MTRKVRIGHYEVTAEEKAAVMAVLESGQISPGPQVSAFESEFAAFHGASEGVMVNSGTDALRIAIAALKEQRGWQDGDRIIVPAVTFVATANAVLQNGLVPYFVDVSLGGDFGLGGDRFGHLIHCGLERVKAVIPVHLFGQPCQIREICEIAKKHNLAVIEDSCETMGVRYGLNWKTGMVGSYGDVACFSSYTCHLLQTGAGGIAITSDPELAGLMRSYANHGRDLAYIPGRPLPDLSKETLERRFRFERIGYSARATEMQAALARVQLRHLPETLAARNRVAEGLLAQLEPFAGVLALPYPESFPPREHGYMMFPLLILNPAIDRTELCLSLERRGIETRELLPIINQPCYAQLIKSQLHDSLETDFPNACQINRSGFYIGSHPHMTEDDINYVADSFREALKEQMAVRDESPEALRAM